MYDIDSKECLIIIIREFVNGNEVKIHTKMSYTWKLFSEQWPNMAIVFKIIVQLQ